MARHTGGQRFGGKKSNENAHLHIDRTTHYRACIHFFSWPACQGNSRKKSHRIKSENKIGRLRPKAQTHFEWRFQALWPHSEAGRELE